MYKQFIVVMIKEFQIIVFQLTNIKENLTIFYVIDIFDDKPNHIIGFIKKYEVKKMDNSNFKVKVELI